jgi:putative phosphoesterase
MKILVFSDTHGQTEKMREIIFSNKADTDLVIHLGDCFTDMTEIRDDFPEIAFLCVAGNCDRFFSNDFPLFNLITLEGVTLFFAHGHQYAVQSSLSSLVFAAKSKNASVALFGHTHVPFCEECDGITLFNPGSLELPRDGDAGSYGIINVKDGRADFKIIRVAEN